MLQITEFVYGEPNKTPASMREFYIKILTKSDSKNLKLLWQLCLIGFFIRKRLITKCLRTFSLTA